MCKAWKGLACSTLTLLGEYFYYPIDLKELDFKRGGRERSLGLNSEGRNSKTSTMFTLTWVFGDGVARGIDWGSVR